MNLKDENKKTIYYTKQEGDILNQIKHPNVIEYKYSYFNEQNEMFYLVLEYAEKGDLK